ncbi:MAG TPA: L-dopachrome tautomerase-related protein [Candidatus Binatia bacterium]|jgi:sugar lactone lactonase YvrE
MKTLLRIVGVVVAVLLSLLGGIVYSRSGGSRLPDRSKAPLLSSDAVEKVADLDFPPGNIAVSAEGRIFFTLHPDGHPSDSVVELSGGKPVPFPDEAFQHPREDLPYFQSILAVRIDRLGRLWVLDFARFGRGTPRILAFDTASGRIVHRYEFPSSVAGLGSMLNDFQVDPEGRYIFIAETSPVLQTPALIVYDTRTKTSRRVLQGHPSVQAEPWIIQAGARRMMLPGGILPLRIAVDSIALSRDGQWLYYGAVTGSRMYRVRASDLVDTSLDAATLASRVENFADKTLTDGLTTDDAGNVYIGDMEHSAIHRLKPDGSLETLVADPRLRWPDGFSFGPGGMLYVTCSALQDVLFLDDNEIRSHGPYQIWRLHPPPSGGTPVTAAPGQ